MEKCKWVVVTKRLKNKTENEAVSGLGESFLLPGDIY
jgi:hypothetical protein